MDYYKPNDNDLKSFIKHYLLKDYFNNDLILFFNNLDYIFSRRRCYIVKNFLDNLDKTYNTIEDIRKELKLYDKEKRYLEIDRKKLTKKENSRRKFYD